MRHLLIAGVIVLTSTAAVPAQTKLAPDNTQPMNLTFIAEARVGEVLAGIGRIVGITVEFDATVTEEMQRAPVGQRIRLNNASLADTLDVLTSTTGLTYTVTGPKAIRISKKV